MVQSHKSSLTNELFRPKDCHEEIELNLALFNIARRRLPLFEHYINDGFSRVCMKGEFILKTIVVG